MKHMNRSSRTARSFFVPTIALVVALLLSCTQVYAQVAGSEGAVSEGLVKAPSISFWNVIASGGIIGTIILIMSLIAVSFVIEHFISIRRERLLPQALIGQLTESLNSKDFDRAAELCRTDNSYLAEIVGAGLTQIGAMFGFFDMQNAMQEASEREISKLHRKLEYLTFIASSAPMMGLLGTVTGMIAAFNQIAQTEGAARPSQLAGGISEALVTTCLGLVVAIPTMFFVSLFRNRIQSYVAQTEVEVEKLMGQFRKQTAK